MLSIPNKKINDNPVREQKFNSQPVLPFFHGVVFALVKEPV
jgi:hypothetical protein